MAPLFLLGVVGQPLVQLGGLKSDLAVLGVAAGHGAGLDHAAALAVAQLLGHGEEQLDVCGVFGHLLAEGCVLFLLLFELVPQLFHFEGQPQQFLLLLAEIVLPLEASTDRPLPPKVLITDPHIPTPHPILGRIALTPMLRDLVPAAPFLPLIRRFHPSLPHPYHLLPSSLLLDLFIPMQPHHRVGVVPHALMGELEGVGGGGRGGGRGEEGRTVGMETGGVLGFVADVAEMRDQLGGGSVHLLIGMENIISRTLGGEVE